MVFYAGDKAPDSGYVTFSSPVTAINSLIETVELMNLQQGIDNSIDANLFGAIDSLKLLMITREMMLSINYML